MQTELLAPAGDLEAAYAAFHFGADAVYLGLNRFSARAEAVNFTPEQLDELTAYAHHLNRKVYVAVNTLVQDFEIPSLMDTFAICERCHVDAVIVQDLGAARLVRKCFPKLELHASTQMAVHNLAGALALKKLGFTRVVTARELTLPEIETIRDKSGLEVEVFVHGALCFSYSGLCYFSSMETARSANRGKCVYSCRGAFKKDGKISHLFSMKDLALEKDVLKLSGLSLKIEGRKKTALYVGAVTDYYRRILDTGKIDAGLTDNLKQIFARPWTKLHFNGRRKDVTDTGFVGHRGLHIGTVGKIFNQTISFKPTRPVARYDGIQLDVPGQEKPFGFSAEHLVQNGKPVFEAVAGKVLTLTLPPHSPFIKKGTAVYLASSTRVKGAYPYTKPKPKEFQNKTPVDVSVFITTDSITACTLNETVTIPGTFEPAQNPAKMRAAVQQSFEKTGDTPFQLHHLTYENPQNLFVPASILNDMRRAVYEAATATLDTPQTPATPACKFSGNTGNTPKWIIKTDDIQTVRNIDLTTVDEITIVLNPKMTVTDLAHLPAEKVRLSLPPINRTATLITPKVITKYWDAGFRKWEAGNPGALSLIPVGADIAFDFTLSVLNRQAMAQSFELGATRVTFSPEDTSDNIQTLAGLSDKTCLVVYQDTPLFLSDNCVKENACADCDKATEITPISNEKGHFTLIARNCQTIVVRDTPLSLMPAAARVAAGWYRVDFCYKPYTPAQTARIWNDVRAGKRLTSGFTGNFQKKFA